MTTKTLRIGVVQIDCQPGCVQENLRHATGLVETAAGQGAQLVLLPELMPGGYQLTEAIWDCAEPFQGPTVAWLTTISKRLGIYTGTTFLEAEGEDFYNTFALATPGGEIAGRVRKSPPASLEAYFYRAGADADANAHYIDTALGRIGVGICYENLLFERLNGLYDAAVDLVLQPTAAGRLMPMKPGDIQLFDSMLETIPPHFAQTLGVPVALADRTGKIVTEMPAGLGIFNSDFPGLSRIVDSDGQVKAHMGAEEGVIVAEVTLDPARKSRQQPQSNGDMWAFPVPWYAPMWPQTQHDGEKDYAINPRRGERAQQRA